MLFKYIGDNLAPKETTFLGYEFKINGEAVDVKEADVIAKMQGSASFEEVVTKDVTPFKTFEPKTPMQDTDFTEEDINEIFEQKEEPKKNKKKKSK